MKKLTIKTTICVLLVGLSVLVESNAQGQTGEGGYGTCNSDNNTAPTPNCNPESTSITWITGTAHCQSHISANSECWATTVTATKHTEPVTWSGDFVENGGTFIYDPDTGNEWVYPPFYNSAECVVYVGLTLNGNAQIFLCSNYSVGADTQTSVSGPGCEELDL